jgi:hypothetical protein
MNLQDLTDEQLKALGWDWRLQLDQAQANVTAIYEELQRRARLATQEIPKDERSV